MKKFLFLLMLTGITIVAGVNAQTPKPKIQTNRVDTSKQDRMPVIKPRDNSTIPVMKPRGNSTMPIVKPVPDTMVNGNSKPKM